MARFESVVFDLDGTLADSGAGVAASIRHAMAELGRTAPPAKELTRCVGPPLRTVFSELLATGEREKVESAVRHYLDYYAREGIFQTVLFPGVPEMLERLYREDLRLFVVTNKLTSNAHRILKLLAIDSYFDSVIGAESGGRMSDKSRALAFMVRKESLSPRATAMVGDREHDIIAARRCGVFSVAVSYGYGDRAELEASQPEGICAAPADVADLLLGSAWPSD